MGQSKHIHGIKPADLLRGMAGMLMAVWICLYPALTLQHFSMHPCVHHNNDACHNAIFHDLSAHQCKHGRHISESTETCAWCKMLAHLTYAIHDFTTWHIQYTPAVYKPEGQPHRFVIVQTTRYYANKAPPVLM